MKIGVSGITGRMGKEIALQVIQDEIAELTAGLIRQNGTITTQNLGEFLNYPKIDGAIFNNCQKFVENCQAVIDFSSPQLSLEIAKFCAKYNKIMVCGTTGFSNEEKEELRNYGKNCVIIWSANMSIGVNILMNLVEKTATILRDDFDIEIIEAHHKNKVDAPSGTALMLGTVAALSRGISLEDNAKMSRSGNNCPRKKGEIGFSTIRGGDIIGDHNVIFAGEGERIEIAHKASNRNIFAKGAIRAAIWGSAQKFGFYSMRDVLTF